MKNLLLGLLLVVFTLNTSAQSREISVSFSGYLIETSRYYNENGYKELDTHEAVSQLCNIGLGYYFPLLSPAPNFGAGINAGLTGGLRWHSTGLHEIFGDLAVPVTAVVRFGAGSTREAYMPVGVGLGAGARLSAWVLPSGDPFYEKEDPVIRPVLSPYFFGELVFDFQKRDRSFFDNFKVQYSIQPVYKKNVYDPEVDEDIQNRMFYSCITFIKFLPID